MKKLLVVVDFQVDFVVGTLGFEGAEALDERIASQIEAYLEEGQDVVCTYDTHFEDYLETKEGRGLPITHCVKGTPGWELYGRTGKLLENAKSFEKYTFGSFEFGEYLLENPYDEIRFVGLVTNICVISNAVIAKSVLPEAQIIIDAKATGSADLALHHKALEVMQSMLMQIDNWERQ